MSMLVTIFASIVDYSQAIRQEMEVTEAAAAGANYAAIPGNQTNLTGIQNIAIAAAPDVSGMSAVATNVYTCTPGGAAVTSTTTCAGYGTPIEYVKVKTSATIHPVLKYVLPASFTTLNGVALYRVQWTQ
jgi:Flp pilus assembly protein TadG